MASPLKVRIGFAPVSPAPFDVATFALVVDTLEETGFDSIWLPELMTGPTVDPLIGLAFVAGRTGRLKLGTQLIVPGRNVFRLARETAWLDRLSGGRLLLTFVVGLEEGVELSAVRVAKQDRQSQLEAALGSVRRLWAGEEVDGVRLDVRPVQEPLEVWLGGMGPKALERAGRLSEGWIPGFVDVETAAHGKEKLEEAATAAGRVVDPEHFGANVVYSDGPLADSARERLGSRAAHVCIGFDAVRSRIADYVSVGISKFVVRPATPPTDWRTGLTRAAEALLDLQTRSVRTA